MVTEDEIIEALCGSVADGRACDYPHRRMPPVASPAQLDAVEAGLGFALPALLRRIYREVANGGVGPFGGIEGLPPDGYVSDAGDLVVDYHDGQRTSWPDGEPPIPPRVMMLRPRLRDVGTAGLPRTARAHVVVASGQSLQARHHAGALAERVVEQRGEHSGERRMARR